jgi:hypothetical protein
MEIGHVQVSFHELQTESSFPDLVGFPAEACLSDMALFGEKRAKECEGPAGTVEVGSNLSVASVPSRPAEVLDEPGLKLGSVLKFCINGA